MNYQRSWSNSRLEKRNIRETPACEKKTLTDSNGFCEIAAWESEKCRLNKGNIFPSRKSLVSDIPAGEGKTAKPFLRCNFDRVSMKNIFLLHNFEKKSTRHVKSRSL
jgi:hypothetical protein